jgi:hypothetical protein
VGGKGLAQVADGLGQLGEAAVGFGAVGGQGFLGAALGFGQFGETAVGFSAMDGEGFAQVAEWPRPARRNGGSVLGLDGRSNSL